MDVDRPSCIELHVHEKVQFDRLRPTTADVCIAEQHGAQLAPGVAQVQLDKGLYHFRTLDNAQLRVIAGGIQVDGTSDSGPGTVKWLRSAGHGSCGRAPALRVVDATAGAS